MDTTKQLAEVLTKYAVPDPKIVGKLPKKNGILLDFVGHADITRILIEIDPMWSWEPCGWVNGRPHVHVENGMATMWARLTVHGKSMLGVGSAHADKAELDKELVGDFLRNAAMRFGISLALWTKQEWEDLGSKPVAPVKKPAKAKAVAQPVEDNSPVDPEVLGKFARACADANLDHDQVADRAGVDLHGTVTVSDMTKLRVAFKEMMKA